MHNYNPLRVAVLGCGPAGLFAAHAAVQAGAKVTIYSKPRKSFMRGAQYLHAPIGDLSGEPFVIQYVLEGTLDGYREKVYGDKFDLDVSPQALTGSHPAWDIREAYDAAWERYGDNVNEWDVAVQGVPGPGRADLVISTVPAHLLCSDDSHEFLSQKVFSTDFVKPGITDEYAPDNVVVCSGDPDDRWYRASRIQGWENTEFPIDAKRPYAAQVWEVEKPITNNCKCHPEVVRLGRYGAWRKGVLSHEAYEDTLRLVGERVERRKAALR